MTQDSPDKSRSKPVKMAQAALNRAGSSTTGLLRDIGDVTKSTLALPGGVIPLAKLLSAEDDITQEQLSSALDRFFRVLYRHPLTSGTARATDFLRKRKMLPNEQSTEDLIRFVVDQAVQRSPVQVPDYVINEFWSFFDELFSAPELKGMGEVTLDMLRVVLRTYEPQLVEIINLINAGRRFNAWQLNQLMQRASIVRRDTEIMRRQVKALRYIKPFFETDPKDFSAQAKIVAQMVREFGPFFIKMAQAAAANSDFLPEEIAKELAVFHEDVPPMSGAEVRQAFQESFGRSPEQMYMDFDADAPMRSGSIGSVYIAKKPFTVDGEEVLRQVVVKVGRQNLDREFIIGKMVLGLAIMSSQYWAPHSKLTPFLRALQEQVDEFVHGFHQELDFNLEARNQLKFYERSMESATWRVPALYTATHRILEMEYLEDATSLIRAIEKLSPEKRRRFQKRLAERFLYTLLSHIFVYKECHGDLHPGNIMVDAEGELYLIDWGNAVQMEGKWIGVWRYLVGAVLADPELLADALIDLSTDVENNLQRRDEIVALLKETLAKKNIRTLRRRGFLWELARGGMEGLHRRGQTVLHLMSNTQHLGLVIRGDYLHLSRSIFAAAGSYAVIYTDSTRWTMLRDLFLGLGRMPLIFAGDRAKVRIRRVRERVAASIPMLGDRRREVLPPSPTLH